MKKKSTYFQGVVKNLKITESMDNLLDLRVLDLREYNSTLLLKIHNKRFSLHLPSPGAAEQDPPDWWISMKKTMTLLLDKNLVSMDDIVGFCNTSGVYAKHLFIVSMTEFLRPPLETPNSTHVAVGS